MFDIHQSPYDEYGEAEEGQVDDYCDALMKQFAASPEGSAAEEEYDGIGWAHTFLYYGFTRLDSTPPEMSRGDVEEILFEIFPEKVSTEPESAGEIIGEMRAFWEFLHRQYGLTNATEILQGLGNDAAPRLERELANPENFGIAKSFFMTGQEAGFDMTTQEGLDEFTLAYHASLAANRVQPTAPVAIQRRPRAPSPSMPKLSATERKSREKLRRKKLRKSKQRR